MKEKERQENIINIQECIWRRSKTPGILVDAMTGIKKVGRKDDLDEETGRNL